MRKTPRSIALLAASLLSAGVGSLVFTGTANAADPTLDDLLNLPVKPGAGKSDNQTPDTAAPAPPGEPAMPLNPEVKKRLTEKEVADLYGAALEDMKVAGERLSSKRDPGVDTQQAQQEAIDKLARLITDLERQQQSNSKSKPKSGDPKEGEQKEGDKGSEQNSGKPGSGKPGSSSGSGKGDGKSKPGQDGKKGDEPGQKTDDGKTDKGGEPGQPGKTHDGSILPPNGGGTAGGTPTTPLEEAKANWGNLPPRVRDELIEGIGEKFSPVYREMTESYYKRLAEEKK